MAALIPTPVCPGQAYALPCVLASLAKSYTPAAKYCSSKYPVASATVTVAGPSSIFTTTVGTTTLPTTVDTSALFLTQTTLDLTSTIDDGVTTILVPTTVAPTTTVYDTETKVVPATTIVTVTTTAPPAQQQPVDSKKRRDDDDDDETQLRAPAVPRAVSVCRNDVLTSGCGYRTCKARCGVDRPYGDYRVFIAGSYNSCERACAEDTRCKLAAYQKLTGRCWLKNASAATARYNAGRDIIECDVLPSAVWSTIMASSTPFVSSACACLQSRGTKTVTTIPTRTVAVTATEYSRVTKVQTSLATATNLVSTHIISTQLLPSTDMLPDDTVTVIATTVVSTSVLTQTSYVTPSPTPSYQWKGLADGSFEQEVSGWTMKRDTTSVFHDDRFAHTGENSLRMSSEHSDDTEAFYLKTSKAYQDLGLLDPFNRYTLSFWYLPYYTLQTTSGNCKIIVSLGESVLHVEYCPRGYFEENYYHVFVEDLVAPEASSGIFAITYDCSEILFPEQDAYNFRSDLLIDDVDFQLDTRSTIP